MKKDGLSPTFTATLAGDSVGCAAVISTPGTRVGSGCGVQSVGVCGGVVGAKVTLINTIDAGSR